MTGKGDGERKQSLKIHQRANKQKKLKKAYEICPPNTKRQDTFQRRGIRFPRISLAHDCVCQKSEGGAAGLRQPLLTPPEAPSAAPAPKKSFVALMTNRDTGGSRSVVLTWLMHAYVVFSWLGPTGGAPRALFSPDAVIASALLGVLSFTTYAFTEVGSGKLPHCPLATRVVECVSAFNHSFIQSFIRYISLFMSDAGMGWHQSG